MSSIHFDPSFWQHVHHPCVIEFSMLFSCMFGQSLFLTWGKQEAKFGGVMSSQKHSL